jgi:quinol monooxygenase YgiN
MIYLSSRQNVSDYAKWRTAFDTNATFRKDAGATGVNQIYRDVENPGTVTAIMEWNNIEKARLHLADPKLKEVMDKAGVTGSPEVRFFNHA